MKSKEERETYINEESDKFICGAVVPEWVDYIINDSIYPTFVNQADMATIITSVACTEAIIRDEFENTKEKWHELATKMDLDKDLLEKYRKIRAFRNKIVHYNTGYESLSDVQKEIFREKCEKMSFLSIEVLFSVLFHYPVI